MKLPSFVIPLIERARQFSKRTWIMVGAGLILLDPDSNGDSPAKAAAAVANRAAPIPRRPGRRSRHPSIICEPIRST